ncbi:MAG TPA: menaquinone biosynthesis protein [Polyangia bacterium]|nr:menaquinone biosynthesis protein [Polyangia bacterium]
MTEERPLRIAAVSFLNARPLTYGLERLSAGRVDLRFGVPSRCAALLAAGEVDLALLPIASYAAASEDLHIVPGIAIAARGAVRTVLLVGTVPWEEMTEIALDPASRSSVVLVQLLTAAKGLVPAFRPWDQSDVLAAVTRTRGALVIGDAAFAAKTFPYVYDLGTAWTAATGLPFVFAVWAGRPHAVAREDIALLQDSLRQGLDHLDDIVETADIECSRLGLTSAELSSYLGQSIRYELGPDAISGAATFLDEAAARGLLPARVRLRLYDLGSGGDGTTTTTRYQLLDARQ